MRATVLRARVRRSDDVRCDALRMIAIIGAVFIACAPVPRVSEPSSSAVPSVAALPNDPVQRDHALGDPLRCTDRASVTQVNDAFEADWSPDSRAIALSRIETISSDTTITGYEEDQRIAVLDLATGAITDRGTGSEPKW